jgi:hypothetical protein
VAVKKTARTAARKVPARKATVRKAAARTAPARKAAVRKAAVPKARARKAKARAAVAEPARKAPSLNRARRTIEGDRVQTPPSSLDFDSSASSARSGRRELQRKFNQHTEASPALTGGDVDADWESAFSSGEEAPGGDNMTPDQDLVDDIGRAVGVEYEDDEELKGADKVAERDQHRWELNPGSSDDFDERD